VPSIDELARAAGFIVDARKELSLPEATLLVLLESDRLVGFCSARSSLEEAEIMDIVIEPAFRRRGLGKRLLHACLEAVLRPSVTRVLLEVRKSHLLAQALYHAVGFRQVGARPRYYRDGEDALIMAYVVGEAK
jgi:ribosomal-protein-alanine N-acetyltransferase